MALEQVLEREGLGWLIMRADDDQDAGDDDHARLTALIDTTLEALSPALPSGFPAVGGLVTALQDLRELALS